MCEFFKALASPYVLVLAVLGAALFIAWRRAESNRRAVRVALISWLTLIAMSNRCVSHVLSATLEWHYPIVANLTADIDAIVVLAGGVRPPGRLRERAVLSTNSMRRCLHAAELYHRMGPYPLILCGGKVDPSTPGPAEAEVSGTAALYRGDWKITKTPEPFGDGQWRLYDIARDPGETSDVAAQHPVVFQEMLNAYQAYAEEVGVFELAAGESARKQLVINAFKKFAINYWYLCLAILAALAVALHGIFRAFRVIFRRRPAQQARA